MMQTNVTEYLRWWRRRALGVVGALVLTASTVAGTASTVSAAIACHSPSEGDSIMCLAIEPLGSDLHAVYIGIAVYGSYQDTPPLLVAYIIDDEGGVLFEVPLSSQMAWDGGLSAEFYVTVDASALNEHETCKYAQVMLFDARSSQTRIFTSSPICSSS